MKMTKEEYKLYRQSRKKSREISQIRLIKGD